MGNFICEFNQLSIFGYDIYKLCPWGSNVEWLGQLCKYPLLYMLMDSHDQPHGVWTVIDCRQYVICIINSKEVEGGRDIDSMQLTYYHSIHLNSVIKLNDLYFKF